MKKTGRRRGIASFPYPGGRRPRLQRKRHRHVFAVLERSAHSVKHVLWLIFFLALTFATRCANYADVFVNGQIYFADGDCYSRMTRVREVLAHPGTIIRHHAWENSPDGTSPHTTAPMDYLIALLALLLKPFSAHYIDLAGAIVSPILGLLTTWFLWYWSLDLIQRFRKVMLLLVSLSPILVQGTKLGRPDHQSLLIFLMAVALGAELALARTPSVKWSTIGGIAWALGIWVSLYEPLILMATIFLTKFIFFRPQLFARERRYGNIIFFTIILIAAVIERWHVAVPDETIRHYFKAWSETVGEMSSGRVLLPLLQQWVGWGLFIAPLLLIARVRDAKRSILLLTLLATTFALTMTQARWGYFFALVFAVSLPWQLSLFAHHPASPDPDDDEQKPSWLRPAAVWCIYILSLWPVAREWDTRLYPDAAQAAVLQQARYDNAMLRDAASHLGEYANEKKNSLPVLAAWWISPAIVYWSGQPAVAGSSHESLPGIVDSARFFTAIKFSEAQEVLNARQVRAVILEDPQHAIETSSVLLEKPEPQTGITIAEQLWAKPSSANKRFRRIYENTVFKIFLIE